MAKKNIGEKILVFYSDSFAFPCSLHSTAIVSPRGVSAGHSSLGDSLLEGYRRFSRHVREDSPDGVITVPQYTGAITKLDAFKVRYPGGSERSLCGSIELKKSVYIAEEEAFLIRPHDYLDWLLKEASKNLDLTVIPQFITEVKDDRITTVDGGTHLFDQLVIAGGAQNALWAELFPDKKNSKSVQGSYLEFHESLGNASFSLTLEGDNLIHDSGTGTILIGSTTRESSLHLAPENELREIYSRLAERVTVPLPEFSSGTIKVGLREKASKRESYIVRKGSVSMIGGFYKNGYTLGLHVAENFLKQYLSSPVV